MQNLNEIQLSQVGAGSSNPKLLMGAMFALSVMGTEMFVAGVLNKYCTTAILLTTTSALAINVAIADGTGLFEEALYK